MPDVTGSAVENLIVKRRKLRTRIVYLCAWHPDYDEPEKPGWLATLSQRDLEIEEMSCAAGPLYRKYLTLGAELHRRLRIRLLPGA